MEGSNGALVPLPQPTPLAGGTKVIQFKRRLGTPGLPATLADGEPAYNDPGGGAGDQLVIGSGGILRLLVSNARQVELYGDQTITGNKSIDISHLHIMGGNPTDILSTNGDGGLSWIQLDPGGATLTISDTPPPFVPGGLWWDSAGLQLYVGYDDGTSQQWVATTNTTPPAAVSEAPLDNAIYGRRGLDSSWQLALPTAGGTMTGLLTFLGTEALGIRYGGQDPTGSYYALAQNATGPFETVDLYRNGTLVNTLATLADVAAGGLSDAPQDGFSYVRRDGAWVRSIDAGTF